MRTKVSRHFPVFPGGEFTPRQKPAFRKVGRFSRIERGSPWSPSVSWPFSSNAFLVCIPLSGFVIFDRGLNPSGPRFPCLRDRPGTVVT